MNGIGSITALGSNKFQGRPAPARIRPGMWVPPFISSSVLWEFSAGQSRRGMVVATSGEDDELSI
jgi:hypothetical protein